MGKAVAKKNGRFKSVAPRLDALKKSMVISNNVLKRK